jgi:hypothetical protein
MPETSNNKPTATNLAQRTSPGQRKEKTIAQRTAAGRKKSVMQVTAMGFLHHAEDEGCRTRMAAKERR